jgi:hypothetical protein
MQAPACLHDLAGDGHERRRQVSASGGHTMCFVFVCVCDEVLRSQMLMKQAAATCGIQVVRNAGASTLHGYNSRRRVAAATLARHQRSSKRGSFGLIDTASDTPVRHATQKSLPPPPSPTPIRSFAPLSRPFNTPPLPVHLLVALCNNRSNRRSCCISSPLPPTPCILSHCPKEQEQLAPFCRATHRITEDERRASFEARCYDNLQKTIGNGG